VTDSAEAVGASHRVAVTLPEDTPGELFLPLGTETRLQPLPPQTRLRLSRYALPPGTTWFDLPWGKKPQAI